MQLQTQKKLTTIATWLFCLFGGIEYAVIIPSLNLFLEDLGAPQYFLGIVLSAFSFSGLFAAPVFGIWQDRTSKTKAIILFANMFEIAGNFLYFVGRSEYFLLAGRLIAGVGGGVMATIFAQISRTTHVNQRTAVISLAMAARQFGLLFGPGFNLFLSKLDFSIGPFVVNDYTSPGLFMTIMWIILQILMIFMYFDLPMVVDAAEFADPIKSQGSPEDGTIANGVPTQDGQYSRRPQVSSKMETAIENMPISISGSYEESDAIRAANGRLSVPSPISSEPSLTTSSNLRNEIRANKSLSNSDYIVNDGGGRASSYGAISVNNEESQIKEDVEVSLILKMKYKDMTFFQKLNELIREEIVVILFAQFVFLFNQTALEACLTPITQKYLSFGEIANSLLFCAAGIEVIMGFFLVRWMSRRCQDRTLTIIGLLAEIIPLIILLYFLPQAKADDRDSNIVWLMTSIFMQVIGLPFIAVASVASFSKMVPLRIQGFGQGIRRATGGIATILGPLWAGGAVTQPYLLLSVLLTILVICTTLTVLSWKQLKTTEGKKMPSLRTTQKSCQFEDEETEPLLSTEGGIDI
ncbi:uncharacterized protein LOC117119166 [Anneissia japonica]|uniref:uncharacterized protein LOC117119166 n=1 Tax=Anneissia japonica TaxID=1529436 RepID=UPI0014254D87|nr:uncharacterized protein LOC117119166 [Anneissia japonica]